MKAYKCDICQHYCDDVLTVHGISKPDTHKNYERLNGQSADCCGVCYDKIMERIAEMMNEQ